MKDSRGTFQHHKHKIPRKITRLRLRAREQAKSKHARACALRYVYINTRAYALYVRSAWSRSMVLVDRLHFSLLSSPPLPLPLGRLHDRSMRLRMRACRNAREIRRIRGWTLHPIRITASYRPAGRGSVRKWRWDVNIDCRMEDRG